MLVLDGAYLNGYEPLVFRRIAAPTERELQLLVERIAERIGRALERDGLISRDCENAYLNFDPGASHRGPGACGLASPGSLGHHRKPCDWARTASPSS
jgi:hypothetical protein